MACARGAAGSGGATQTRRTTWTRCCSWSIRTWSRWAGTGKSSTCSRAPEILARTGIEYFETDRGGDVTYHGPGQLVGYPILDLREWRRDVHAYFSGVEQALIEALETFGIAAGRIPERGYEGVWVQRGEDRRYRHPHQPLDHLAWFALNVETDLKLLPIYCSLRIDEARLLAASLGCKASAG